MQFTSQIFWTRSQLFLHSDQFNPNFCLKFIKKKTPSEGDRVSLPTAQQYKCRWQYANIPWNHSLYFSSNAFISYSLSNVKGKIVALTAHSPLAGAPPRSDEWVCQIPSGNHWWQFRRLFVLHRCSWSGTSPDWWQKPAGTWTNLEEVGKWCKEYCI